MLVVNNTNNIFQMNDFSVISLCKIHEIFLSGDFRGPDGMDFDEHNNLLVTYQTSGSIEVFPPGGGEPTESIRCPFARPSNLHFRPRSRQVYVTEHNFHGLWRFQWDFCGKLQMCDLENV